MIIDSLSQILKKKALDPSLVLVSYLLHFEFVLSDLKPDGCVD
jgi:hypothetical protein